ncbi:hypothetical protein V5799_018040 [Amblyomma americanum]|uniref:N-acetyltransferase domain-containing protein n=1 Tax=Amblyomma americanum TaxID=6943 RepID=A0AAQ4F104_AMBAM
MVEASLQIFVRDIEASETLSLRKMVLRPDLACVNYRGDDLATTAHFGAYVNGRLVGVASAFNEPLNFPEAQRLPPQHNCVPSAEASVEVCNEGSDLGRDNGSCKELSDQHLGSESNELISEQVSKLTLDASSEPEGMPRVVSKEDGAQKPAGEVTEGITEACSQGGRPASTSSSQVCPNIVVAASEWTQPPQPSVERAIKLASEANSWRIRGLAVELPLRGRGLGSRLISACIQHAVQQRAACIWCVARCSAEPVYEKMGFQRAGQVFQLEGIGPVRYMVQALI